nr:zinc-dependent metalloprotease [Bryobacter sp.]
MRRLLWLLPLLASAATIEEKTAGLEKMPGFLNLYWDAKAGKMWLEIDKLDRELLYVASLPAGVGSNDIGLDRGRMGQEKVVVFERSGPKVLLIEQNYGYRANSPDANERRAVQESFARSALWGFEVAAETGSRVLVDATAFFLRGAAGVPEAIRRANQGAFRLDASRSAFYLPRTKNFPKNTEVDVTLTFTGDAPGGYVRQVVPSPEAITVREHHSFIELPDANFKPRAFDPRSGYIQLSYMDFATPVEEPIRKRFILRHRLEKKDPRAKVSEAVKPLVYYVDRGAPEPIRTALVEGARWWAQAFEAAGFKDAFRVELMPEGADSMDVRYNVIQWVHRSTRGWSYGGAISDPRTGEILKGIVTLGSLRIRQDYLIAEGLLAPYADGKMRDERLMEMSLSRIRQLSVHEVGHTLGLVHNFAASTMGRASVMDYPAPQIDLKNGSPDLSNAYATGVGEWDKVAIAYGYAQFPPGADEAKELDRILRDAEKRGLYCISDEDARDPSGPHPAAHLWDTGTNAIDELDRMMQVRQRALARFGENNIRNGAPWSTLEEPLVTTYLMHRYQVEAAVKVVGGVDYRYGLRGDGQPPPAILDSATQRRALSSLLATLQPEALELPERLL